MSETSSDNIIWTVTFGAVYKVRHGKAMKVYISLRDRNGKWLDSSEMTDERGDYKDLGVDQFAVAQVAFKEIGGSMRCKDLYTITLDHGGDSTTVAKAIHAGKFHEMLDKTFHAWLKKVGPIKLLKDGSDTYIMPDMLAGRYDNEDLQTLRKAYAHELKEDLASRPDAEELYTKGVERFNSFLSKLEESQGDQLFWFEKWAPLAARAGYVILRNNQIVAHMLMVMG